MNSRNRESQREMRPIVTRRSGVPGGESVAQPASPGIASRRLKSPTMTNSASSARRASPQPLRTRNCSCSARRVLARLAALSSPAPQHPDLRWSARRSREGRAGGCGPGPVALPRQRRMVSTGVPRGTFHYVDPLSRARFRGLDFGSTCDGTDSSCRSGSVRCAMTPPRKNDGESATPCLRPRSPPKARCPAAPPPAW